MYIKILVLFSFVADFRTENLPLDNAVEILNNLQYSDLEDVHFEESDAESLPSNLNQVPDLSHLVSEIASDNTHDATPVVKEKKEFIGGRKPFNNKTWR